MKFESLEFPQPGDSIFSESTDWKLNACVVRSFDVDPDRIGYIEGYRIAANKVFEYVQDNHQDQGKVIYPILFLWQHHIEITLKQILSMICDIKGEQGKSEDMDTHNLIDLWNTTIGLLSEVYPQVAMDTNILAAGRLMKQLRGLLISKGQEGFRYPKTLKSKSTVETKFRHINLETLDTMMKKLGNLLECILTELRVIVKEKDEFSQMQSYLESEMSDDNCFD